jgi:hypothetical protein
LWAGVVLVAGAVVVGARVLATADDTVAVWQMTADQRAGTALEGAQVQRVHVRLDDDVSDHYLAADGDLDAGLTLTGDVRSGELLAVGDVTDDPVGWVELPLLVPNGGLPTGLAVGQVVDVWAVRGSDGPARATRLLDDVRVTSVAADDVAGVGSDRAVSVGLPADVDPQQTLEELAGGSVVLLRVGP